MIFEDFCFFKYQICTALIASKILRIFSEELPEFHYLDTKAMYWLFSRSFEYCDYLDDHFFFFRSEFENLAIDLLKVYDKNTRDSINDLLVVRYIPLVDMDCLELASKCQCSSFLATHIVQHILNNIWTGKKHDYSRLVRQFYLNNK